MASSSSKWSQKFQAFWNHPAGPKTTFFWAPTFKWSLVIANIADIQRPPEKISRNQTFALACTGLIWSRYALVIIPKNINLFSVNIFVFLSSFYQLYRRVSWEFQDIEESEIIPDSNSNSSPIDLFDSDVDSEFYFKFKPNTMFSTPTKFEPREDIDL